MTNTVLLAICDMYTEGKTLANTFPLALSCRESSIVAEMYRKAFMAERKL